MNLTNLRTIKDLLQKYGLKPTKLRGQHFLISEKALGQMIKAAELSREDVVLEIGPGLGVLTEELLKRAGQVIAVEKDARFLKILKEQFAQFHNIEFIHSDILKFNPSVISLRSYGYKVIANIPYYITSDILVKFLQEEPRPKMLVLMIQKEVANRILERDGKSSRLSIFVKYHGAPELIAKVPAGAFYPSPKIDSAIIKIKMSGGKFADNQKTEKEFFELVKIGFAAPRKKLISNLGKKLSKQELTEAFNRLGLDIGSRAEDLMLDDWTELYRGNK